MDEIFSAQYSLTNLEHHSHISFFDLFNISLTNERKKHAPKYKSYNDLHSKQNKSIRVYIKQYSSIKRGKRPQGRSQIK